MDKKIFLKLLVPMAILGTAVMSFLMVLPATKELFDWFSFAWAGVLISGAFGLRYLLGALMIPNDVISKKISIYFGCAFLVLAFFCLTWAFVMPKEIIAPIVSIIIAAALFLGVLFTGGKKWDGGENEKVGYKNYHQRKAEEERKNKSN